MPNLQPLSVNDRAATPLAHVFTPRADSKNQANGVSQVSETGATPKGERNFTISLRRVGTKYKGRLVLTNPVVASETINGVTVPRVVRVAYAALDVTFDELSTVQERKDTIGMLADALAPAKVLVNDTFVNLEGIW